MADENANPVEPRTPLLADLVQVCRELNAKRALEILPDKAVLELGDDDLRDWVVVRVCDEIVVDLMTKACGISYQEGKSEIEMHTIDSVPIPFASPSLLLRTKQTYRDRDAEDRTFLGAKIAGKLG